jgi:glyoxylate carboligase
MIKQLKAGVVAAVILGGGLSFAMPSYATDAPKKQVSCKQEAKHAGIKDAKKEKAYIKNCEKNRKEMKKQAKLHKAEQKPQVKAVKQEEKSAPKPE